MSKIWLPENVRDSLKVEKMEWKLKQKKAFKTKNILKKCSVCGKEEFMFEKQIRCHECVVKAKKQTYANTHCLCGRRSRFLVNGLCSFCLQRKTSKISKTPTILNI